MDYTNLISPALGIFIGTLMGLTGAGGGILSVPLLVFALHLEVATAGPIALSAIALAAGVGAFLGLKAKILRYKAAGLMAIFGLMLSPFGLWAAQRVPNAPLLISFSMLLVFVSIRLFIQARNESNGYPTKKPPPPPCLLDPSIGKLIWTVPCARSLVIAGAFAGFLSGLLGVGGGFIIVPALKKYTNLPMKSVVATSLGVLAIISTGGALLSALTGSLNLTIAAPFALGVLAGLLLGKLLETRISGTGIQQIFSIFTMMVAIGLLIKGISGL